MKLGAYNMPNSSLCEVSTNTQDETGCLVKYKLSLPNIFKIKDKILIYIKVYIYKVFKEKIKQNISATDFINSLLPTSHFFLMINFKTNLQVIMYIIYINEPLNFEKDVYKLMEYLIIL